MKKILFFSLILLGTIAYSLLSPFSDISGDVISDVKTERKMLYLTFDDGPGEDTSAILDILNEKEIKATFFVVGERIKEHPDVLDRISSEGHSIGVHSMNHNYLITNIDEELRENIGLVEILTGKRPNLFRPPYGFRTYKTIKSAENLGLRTVTWSSFPMDYAKKSDDIIWFVSSSFYSGQIICLHDGPAKRTQTVIALSEIIDLAKEQGYEFGFLE